MKKSRPVGLVLDPLFERHDTGPGHPEHAGRLLHLREVLTSSGLADRCTRVEPRPAEDADLGRAHQADYIDRVERACAGGERQLDSMDTAICAESAVIARQAAGALGNLCDQVARGELSRGFAAMRPPGATATTTATTAGLPRATPTTARPPRTTSTTAASRRGSAPCFSRAARR